MKFWEDISHKNLNANFEVEIYKIQDVDMFCKATSSYKIDFIPEMTPESSQKQAAVQSSLALG